MAEETYQTGLRKELGTFDLFCLGLGSTIGWGVWTQSGDWFVMSGPVGVGLATVLGALLFLPVLISYCKLTKLFPKAGGCARWTYEAFGTLPGFLCGWWLAIAYVTIILLNVTAFSVWLRILLPGAIEYQYLYTIGGYPLYAGWILAAVMICLSFVFLNHRGIKLAGKAQTLIGVGILAGGLVYVAAALSRGHLAYVLDPSPFSLQNGPSMSVMLWLAIVPWAFVGLENVSQGFEEAKTVNVFRVWLPLLVLSMFFYASITLATAMAKPWGQMTGEWLATATAGKVFLGEFGRGLIIFNVLVAILSGINGCMITSTRILYSMGNLGLTPQFFSRIHGKYRTPSLSILSIGLFVIGTTFFGRSILAWFVDIAAFGLATAYIFAGLSLYRLRHRYGLSAWSGLVAVLAVVAGTVFLSLLVALKMETSGVIAILIFTALGLILFYAVARSGHAGIRRSVT